MDNLLENLKNYKIPLSLCLVGLVLVIGSFYSPGAVTPKKDSFPDKSKVLSSQIKQASAEAKIDISGAVNHPAVYSLDKEVRVEDAVKAAGGFSSRANLEYISKHLNMSQKISDGMKIYIPFQGENQLVVTGSDLAGSKVSINNGSLKDLDSLPGIGAVSAQKIIDGRPYQSLEELISKKVISKTVFEKVKELVQLD